MISRRLLTCKQMFKGPQIHLDVYSYGSPHISPRYNVPIGSTLSYSWVKIMINVGKYSIHGASGIHMIIYLYDIHIWHLTPKQNHQQNHKAVFLATPHLHSRWRHRFQPWRKHTLFEAWNQEGKAGGNRFSYNLSGWWLNQPIWKMNIPQIGLKIKNETTT